MEIRKLFALGILLFSQVTLADLNDEYSYPSPDGSVPTDQSRSVGKLIADKDNEIEFDKISIKSVWKKDFIYQYPSMKGLTKNQAATTRRSLLKDAVLSTVKAIKNISRNHRDITSDLENKLQLPLTRNQAEAIVAAIEKLNILEQQEADGDYDIENNLPIYLREVTTKVYGLIPDDNRHSKNRDEIVDDLVQSKDRRIEFMSALVLSAAKLNPKRDNDKIILSVTIDFPQIYKKHPLKPIADYLEK